MSTKCLLDASLSAIYCQTSPGEYSRLWRHIAINQASGQLFVRYAFKEDFYDFLPSVIHCWDNLEAVVVEPSAPNMSMSFRRLCEGANLSIIRHKVLSSSRARERGKLEKVHHLIETKFECFICSFVEDKNISSLEEINRVVGDWCKQFNATDNTDLKQLVNVAFKDNQ